MSQGIPAPYMGKLFLGDITYHCIALLSKVYYQYQAGGQHFNLILSRNHHYKSLIEINTKRFNIKDIS